MGDKAMSIKLQIDVESPLTAEDHGLLTGISIMVLAMSNMPLAKQRFPEAFSEEDEPQRCGAIEITTGFRCVDEVGHTGRHRYRDAMGEAMADATGDPRAVN